MDQKRFLAQKGPEILCPVNPLAVAVGDATQDDGGAERRPVTPIFDSRQLVVARISKPGQPGGKITTGNEMKNNEQIVKTMSNNTEIKDEVFVIEELQFKPEAKAYPGRFTQMRWDQEPKKDGTPVKDLVLVTELEQKFESGQPIHIEHRFNMLPKGRGKAEFKKQMGSWRGGQAMTDQELAGLKKSTVVGKPVVTVYKVDHLGHTVFDRFNPHELSSLLSTQGGEKEVKP
jgi:hypothetical protein